jgi:hypothetical protein
VTSYLIREGRPFAEPGSFQYATCGVEGIANIVDAGTCTSSRKRPSSDLRTVHGALVE